MTIRLHNADALSAREKALADCNELAEHHLTAEKYRDASGGRCGYVSSPSYCVPLAIGEFKVKTYPPFRNNQMVIKKEVGALVLSEYGYILADEECVALDLPVGTKVSVLSLRGMRDAVPYRKAEAVRNDRRKAKDEMNSRAEAERRERAVVLADALGVSPMEVTIERTGYATISAHAIRSILSKHTANA